MLADTHGKNYLHNPTKLIDCSGLASYDRLWSQLVVPIEFKLEEKDADAALGQLVESASIVQRQQPKRKFIYAVSITMDSAEVFCLHFKGLAAFSGILSSGLLPVKLHPDPPGLRMLTRIVACPLAHLGFESAILPQGRLGPHQSRCTRRLAVRTESTLNPTRPNSSVFKAVLPERNTEAVLKLSVDDKEVGSHVPA